MRTHERGSEYPNVDVDAGDADRDRDGQSSMTEEVALQRRQPNGAASVATEPGDEVRSDERQEVHEHGGDADEGCPAERLLEDADAARGDEVRELAGGADGG